jgi:methylenetetrahydrofolate dehydrogenase (NADP+)/methenyltetrahydrofolate cyclohydrolase
MTEIFSGKAFAFKKEEYLLEKVYNLRKKGITPKLVSIIIGNDPASVLYVNLKKKAAERVGCGVTIKNFDAKTKKQVVLDFITQQNTDKKVNGIMIQLPLPANFSEKDREDLIQTIFQDKDVDGLRSNSKFTPPTAKAVIQIMAVGEEHEHLKNYPARVVVVGASGFIGRQIIAALKKLKPNKYKLVELDSKVKNLKAKTSVTDILISVTGVAGLIKAGMVKAGAILIDVGAPKGDIAKATYGKATFVSPVPGGVGPVTISCLLENLVDAALATPEL